MGSQKGNIIVKLKKAKISGSSHKGRQHNAHLRKYQRQAIRTALNKDKARKLHMKLHPTDKIALGNFKRLGVSTL